MSGVERLAYGYGKVIGKYPILIIVLIVVLSAFAQYGNSILKQKIQDNSDMIPDTYAEISSMNKIGNDFGSTETGNIVVEVDPGVESSDEVRDIRDIRVMEYLSLISKKAENLEQVIRAQSAFDIVQENGRVPKTQRVINKKIRENPQSSSYVSEDYTMALVSLNFIDSFDANEVNDNLLQIIQSTKPPDGITVAPSGQFAQENAMHREMVPDMARTSRFSLIGVFIVIILLFWSLRYGLTSLSAIVFGVMWTFGMMGLLGMEVSNITSGGASMIMGIGIDFGIQVTSRFRIELRKKKKDIENAMAETLRVVTMPMGTTTLAALIGFRAMSMGELKVLGELADMMSLGVLGCMMAAITVVPVLLVLGERYLAWIDAKKILHSLIK